MNDLKDRAEKLIKRGKDSGDFDLIRMGMDILDALDSKPVSKPTVIIDKVNSNKFDMGQFTMQKSNVANAKINKKQPISI
jgi:hypothetical protein